MQHVIIKFVFLVPKAAAAEAIHRRRDPEKVLEEFGRDIFVDVIFRRKLDRDSHQVEGKHSHPTRAVALFEMAAVGKRVVAVEHADVVESEEPALENILPFGVLAVHPPGERDQHLVENRFQKCAIAFAGLLAFDLIDTPGGPRQHRRIHIVKIPLVSWNFSVGVLIPFAHDEIELRLGELDID